MHARTRSPRFPWTLVALALLLAAGAPAAAAPAGGRPAAWDAALPFLAAEGRYGERVAFHTPLAGGAAFVTTDGVLVHALSGDGAGGVALWEDWPGGHVAAVRGCAPQPVDVRRLAGVAAGPAVAAFGRLELGEVFPGVEVSLRAAGRNVERIFRLAPGARVADVRVRVRGAESLRVDGRGRLMAATARGELAFSAPVAYQEIGGVRAAVPAAYVLDGDTYGFAVGEHDPALPLIIDPMLAGTYLGGILQDGYFEVPVAEDAAGHVILATRTRDPGFPMTPGVFDSTYGGGLCDIVVAKLDWDCSRLLACTYLGGSDDDVPWPGVAMCLGPDGSVYVAASCKSVDLPTTPGAYQPACGGGYDAWIARLDNDLTTLLAATYLGGTYKEEYVTLTVDGAGRVFVSGCTISQDFPITPGAYDPDVNGYKDLFLSRLDADLTTLEASTYLGGSNSDWGEDLEVDAAGRICVTGWTQSTNFPVTPDAYDPTYNYNYNAYLSVLDADLTTLEASTYLGGSSWEFGYAMVCAPDGTIYIGGHTASTDFPATPGAFDTDYSGMGGANLGDDMYVARFSADLTTLLNATYLGGAQWEIVQTLGLDADGNVYLAGNTSSPDMPLTPDPFAAEYSGGLAHIGDGYVARLDAELTTLLSATYLGGSAQDNVGSLQVTAGGTVLLAGSTGSANFPTHPLAYDDDYAGGGFQYGGDIWVARLDSELTGGVVAALLEEFRVERLPDACLLTWCLSADVAAERLRLVAREAGRERELTVTREPDGSFRALDPDDAADAGRRVYALYLRADGGEWRLLCSRPAPERPASRPRLEAGPNPFNPRTVLRFALPEAGPVRLEILDLQGRVVSVLADRMYPAGEHELVWEGRDAAGRAVPSGVYIARLGAGSGSSSCKLGLVR